MATSAAAMCERIMDRVVAHCAAPATPTTLHPDPPNFDALATSIAAGSAVIMVVTLVVVALGVIVAIAWGKGVIREAKEEAKREVSAVAPVHVRAYLDDKLPGMVAEALAAMTFNSNPSGGASAGGTPAEQAEALGGEPR